ncbi:glycosyltransferase family 2 protein [Undibacterium flavidum]|uniref:Glycosyltransferase family 2 protein n=1 Tax=Undibacterium flavidum TaxID=2762297 RepID=A0ABR6Y6E8_9BURK|nr:glycosyltransferase family 2 protein [Undibacterium flavidum]MBC3872196.1 glycosyltransferase family 2 protein [Undibacterium flavidum]
MIHVAIISHGHEALLIDSKIGGLLTEHEDLTIWIKDNKPAANLKAYCAQHQVFYTDADAGLGFGENNNYLFDLIQKKSGFQADDIFLVMNPDITVTAETVFALTEKMQQSGQALATLNLYRDLAMTVPDKNIRHFPGMLSIIKMPLVNTFSETYDKDRIAGVLEDIPVEWASGAFLAFTPALYEALGGFDPDYFMYFEDVDICYRARRFHQQAVHYYPHLKAIHTAAHKNRNIFSKHALWFFHSFSKFLLRRYLRTNSAYSGKKSASSPT